MARDPRYDILFEPVRIGPATAPNRFYQVPHCSGMGFQMPRAVNAMRAVKAEGGWGVVCTEYCSVDPSSDDAPHAYCTLWDDDDVRNHAAMVEAVHERGALAGVELWHGGYSSDNGLTRGHARRPGLDAGVAWDGPDPRHGQGGHPPVPPEPSRLGPARQAGRVRHRLRLRRPRLSARAVPLARPEPQDRRIRRPLREQGPASSGNCWRTRRKRWATPAPSPSVSPSTTWTSTWG